MMVYQVAETERLSSLLYGSGQWVRGERISLEEGVSLWEEFLGP